MPHSKTEPWYHILTVNGVFRVLDGIGKTRLRQSYRTLQELEFAPRSEVIRFQTEHLRKLLTFASLHVPYYRRTLRSSGFTDFGQFQISDLHHLPVLTRDIVRAAQEDLKADCLDKLHYKHHGTGGTTGEPLKYLLDYSSWSMSWAHLFRGWGFAGYRIGDRVLALGSSSLFQEHQESKEQRLLHTIFRWYPFPAMNMSDEICAAYLRKLRDLRIHYLYGYASALYLLSKYALHNDVAITLRGAFPTSEICPELYKRTISQAFSCPVVDDYGARDGNIAAFQCKFGNYHLGESSIVHIKAGAVTGPVVVTDLFNYAMPFINYELGDIVTLSEETCQCGRNQFLAKEVLGRPNNIIEMGNGRRLTGPGWTILFARMNVAKYRLVKVDEYRIRVELVPSVSYQRDTEERKIVETLRRHFGEEISIDVQYLSDMEVALSGKATYFIGDR